MRHTDGRRQENTHHVDTRSSQCWIDYHAFTRLGLGDERAQVSLLFRDEWGDVRLETSCAETHNNDSKGKRSERPLRMRDDRWNGRYNKNNVADECNGYGDSDSFESPPLLIRNIGA